MHCSTHTEFYNSNQWFLRLSRPSKQTHWHNNISRYYIWYENFIKYFVNRMRNKEILLLFYIHISILNYLSCKQVLV